MNALSMNLRVADRLVVVVGGGRVAGRKAAVLLRAGALVRMIAPKFSADAQDVRDPHLTLIERSYKRGDLRDALLVIAATNDAELNAKVCSDARRARILCSNAGEPSDGDFSLPATSRHGAVKVAVDTGGASPALAKRLLRQIDAQLDPHADAAAQTLAVMRSYVAGLAPARKRRDVLTGAAGLPLQQLAALGPEEARDLVDRALRKPQPSPSTPVQKTATCASRGSRLALAQAATITSRLESAGIASQILTIATHGDLVPDRPLSAMHAENIFVKEIEAALLDGRADYAVHSCKDLPSTLIGELQLVAISERVDPRDAFCSERFASFEALPRGARVGTSSARRRAQLLAMRQDLAYEDCRGNVDTRLRKLRDGEFDALILAMAGLQRLGVSAAHTVPFEPDELVPPVGQGALAIEMRAQSSELAAAIRRTINDARSETAIVCERSALATLGGGCNAPIGIHASWNAEELRLYGVVLSIDGARLASARASACVTSTAQAAHLGRRLAEQLQASGATQMFGGAQRPLPLRGKLILLARTQAHPSRIAPSLEALGARVVQVRSAKEAVPALGEQAVDMVVFPSSGSVEAIAPLFELWREGRHRPAIAAMGPASAAAAAARGLGTDVVADDPSVDSLLQAVQRHFATEHIAAR